MIRVELLRKPACPPCDETAALLRALRDELGFELAEVDVTADAALESRWIDEVPVVRVGDWSVSEGRVPAAAEVRRHLARAAAGEAGERPPVDPATWRRLQVALVALALLGLGSLAGLQLHQRWVVAPRLAEEAFGIERADAPAPDFTHRTDQGGAFTVAAARGQVLFINFWATWCPPCREEMPSMTALGRELERRYPGRFQMVAVSVDDGWEPVREYFAGSPPGITVTLDTDQLATRAYYCAARGSCPPDFKFPETYIVDRSGRLVAYMVGPRNWADPAARRFLERLIDG